MEGIVFKKEHLAEIERQTGKVFSTIQLEHREALEKNGMSFSMIENGKVFACVGLIQYWENRYEGWAIFNKEMKREFVAIHKMVSRYLNIVPHKRIEITVKANFEQGHRWARLLGFELECARMKNYFQNGSDAVLYARVR